MTWCPKCRKEYREGFIKCSDCGIELVNQIEQNEQDKGNTENGENDVFAFLVNVKDEIEYNLLEAKLKQVSIPVLKKYREGGGYLTILTGNPLFGIDIYVPSKLLDTAKEIIKPYDENEVLL